jgi:hypothetical protein
MKSRRNPRRKRRLRSRSLPEILVGLTAAVAIASRRTARQMIRKVNNLKRKERHTTG